jgi:murein DD-endopeptidase MepM/ murein hydrolase activator NlpD
MAEKRTPKKTKRVVYPLALIPLAIILFLFGWFFMIMFEGEKPAVTLQPLPEFLAKGQMFTVSVNDTKRGIKTLKVSLNQGGREIAVHEEKFPFRGLLNRQGVHDYQKEILIDPLALKLAQGEVDLFVHVRDYSRRGGGDGNLTLIQHKMIVDTIPPAIRPVSRMHNINVGGTCLIAYQTSSDAVQSGIFVNDLFFPGFTGNADAQKGIRLCYFPLPHDVRSKPAITLWAEDRAQNVTRANFYSHIRSKRFRVDAVNVTDRFLGLVLPNFSFYPFGAEDSDLKKFLKINNELREDSHRSLSQLKEKTGPEKRWEGAFLRLKKAATMSRFADRRIYYYKGKKVDEKDHLGIDLASLANSPVQAANHGHIVFAERLGIYGNTVVIDHGQGIASMYGHLSKIEVALDQDVQKGETIGYTGQTGLAGGDHLHFAIMVHGIFVNPIEWWDAHWIQDNISRKLDLIH